MLRAIAELVDRALQMLRNSGEAGQEPGKCFDNHPATCFLAERALEHRDAIPRKERIGLDIHPPPDRAIEVDATSAMRTED
jgi:hypothetical protein